MNKQRASGSHSYRPFFFALRGHRLRLSIAVALIMMATLLELWPHLIVILAAAELLPGSPDTAYLLRLAALAFAGVITRFVLLGTGYLLSHKVAFAVMRSLRSQLSQRMFASPKPISSRWTSGYLKKLLVDDVARVEGIFAHMIPEFLSGLLVPLIAATGLFWTDWRLGALALALMPVAFGVQALGMRGFGEAFKQWHEAERHANEGVLEFIRGVVVLKAFNRDASSLARVRDGIYGIRDLATEMTKRSTPSYSTFFALLSGNLLVLLPSGLMLHLNGQISAESLILFIVLGTGLLLPTQRLLFLFGGGQQTLESVTRIADFYAQNEPAPESKTEAGSETRTETTAMAPTPKHFDIELESVDFSYDNAENPTICEVSLKFPAGHISAIVGPSGAGKSTILKLLLRHYDPDKGHIRLGGHDLRDFPDSKRRGYISYVSQDTVLFNDTVRNNLCLAKAEASMQELELATTSSHAQEFIRKLPKGFETQLGERGATLSGGERQRLAIARAMLKNSPVLLLDEISANVDPESEAAIQLGLTALAPGKTVIMVAHRLRSLRDVDQIIVMDQGRVVATGRHDQLLESCFVYQLLWNAQSAAEGWIMKNEASC